MVYRLKEERIVNRETADRAFDRIQGRAHFWETRKNTRPPKRPLRFEALAFEAMDKGVMGTGKFAEYMGISRYQAMKLLEERSDEFWQEDDGVEIEVIDS